MNQGTKVSGEEELIHNMIETLPKEERWGDQWDIYQYQGFWYPRKFLEGLISAQQNFKPQPTDIILCSFPKTGTTWLKALCFAIATRNRYGGGGGDEHNCHNPLFTSVPHDCIPFLEVDLIVQGDDDGRDYKRNPELPLLSTHVPFTSLPKSIVESTSRCKIVYIWRDPKDTFISLWYFLIKGFGNGETNGEFCFETEFDRFCQGKSLYGPFWDHVLGFWNASLECPDKVLFLKYEDMKMDTLFYIKKLAGFMDKPFTENELGVPQKIMEICSFKNLSSLEVNKTGKHRADDRDIGIDNNLYFRKGEVGDWKNHLTVEMVEKIDAITKHKFNGTGLI